jgi:hypothetical protein
MTRRDQGTGRILRAEHVYGVHDGHHKAFSVERFLAMQRVAQGLPAERWQQPTRTVKGVLTYAYVNHSRWVADCPFCSSAQVVTPDDRRFFCVDCGNANVRHAYVEVEWPPDDEIDEIERLLRLRPDEQNRNWYPMEPVAALRAENKTFLLSREKEIEEALASPDRAVIVGRQNRERPWYS